MRIPGTAIGACERILKQSGSSFALAFRLLPDEQRRAMTAFYAFCRCVDDAVDATDNPRDGRAALGVWKDRLAAACRGEAVDDVGRALSWVVREHRIDPEHLGLIVSGVELDLEVQRYARFADLYDYCYRVASAVGLVCLAILGETSERARRYAELTGIGVQLTNILRDVGEDAATGRIYLPQEDLEWFGVSQSDVLEGRMTGSLKRLLRFEAQRARHYHRLAASVLDHHARRRLYFTEALRATYLRLLDRLVEQDFPVLRRRVSVGKREKLVIALRHRLRPAILPALPRSHAETRCV